MYFYLFVISIIKQCFSFLIFYLMSIEGAKMNFVMYSLLHCCLLTFVVGRSAKKGRRLRVPENIC